MTISYGARAIGSRFRGASVVELLRVQILEGDGTADSIARIVTYYVDPKTEEVVSRVDPFEQNTETVATAGEQ